MLHSAQFQTLPSFPISAPSSDVRARGLPTLSVMGLHVVNATTRNTVQALLDDSAARQVYFLNAHCANLRATDRAYADALARADYVLPDGIGIELAARMTGQQLTENLNGTDFTPALMHEAARRGLSVFLMGGTPGTAERAANALCRDIPGLRIAGTMNGFNDAGNEAAAVARINDSGADILLVAMGVPRQELWIDRNAAQLAPRLTLGVGALFDFLAGNVSRAPVMVRKMRCEWIWRLAQEPRRLAKRYLLGNGVFMARAARHALPRPFGPAFAKRAMDITLSLTAVTALLPVLALIGLAIKLDSRGPVFFSQERVGHRGRRFRMMKFRSMHVDAEARRAEVLNTSDRTGICFKSRQDPRITRVGRLLRRTSLDELPQILNILLGQMSIVGPRPALPQEVAAYPEPALERLSVRPGLTGLWQVSGRADIGFDKMVDMDIAYARSRSILLDTLLILLTFRSVFSGRGAY
ncbi:WecB/TagA/CpsF family glycosyltransferase [Thalassovita sp.]|uniref:WecB/TagA/CpsF family glycosyltransferase n=1 Tax=Thalassovita sp. TaxID=1979401 RepID=UPI0028828864|nr:WecB/TagA/CpsF family glycosyltransferase [Thalassovita sp.]MDF1801675.1 WecB/TagA/CpsF family glycosyltransferase [Thalassovita sp.]